MKTSMTIKDVIRAYYSGLSKKSGWESSLTDDFMFKGIGGKLLENQPEGGKDAYITVINRFSRAFESMALKKLIVEEDNAYATACYRLVNKEGKKMDFDIAEFWTIKNDKLTSLTIFYDTVTYNSFMGI